MTRITITILLFFISANFLSGQKETAHWKFGAYAWLDFKTGAPIPRDSSNQWTQFSSSGISDSLGNCLFSVRGGDLVFNRNNDTMANGKNIGGSYAGAQSSIVLRKSGKQYYVIAYDDLAYLPQTPQPAMIRYAVVDMALAAGLGSVTTKSISITSPGVIMASKLAATKHCNKKDHWILTHTGSNPGNNMYYAYLVTASNISTTPFISSIGSNQPRNYGNIPGFYRGLHKFSPNGRKVCATMPYKTVELYDFDNATGVLSNVIKLDSTSAPTPTNYSPSDPAALGIEFSPDGSKLYISYAGNHPFLCQFNLCAGSAQAIAASKTVIDYDTVNKNVGSWYYSLQSALDGKIYVVGRDSARLGVINNPNALGLACNYNPIGQTVKIIGTSKNTILLGSGLPNFESSFFDQKPALPAISSSVNCGSVNFSVPPMCPATGYNATSFKWLFGDSLSGSSNTAIVNNPTHSFSANGSYTVKLVLGYSNCNDTIQTTVNITGMPDVAVSGKHSICKGEKAVLTFSGTSSYSINSSAVFQNTAVLQPTATTVYTITAVQGNSCASKITWPVNVAACIGLNEDGATENSIDLFPNPTTGKMTVRVQKESEITLLTITGQMVLKTTVKEKTELNLSDLNTGVYILRAVNSGKSSTVRVIKVE